MLPVDRFTGHLSLFVVCMFPGEHALSSLSYRLVGKMGVGDLIMWLTTDERHKTIAYPWGLLVM